MLPWERDDEERKGGRHSLEFQLIVENHKLEVEVFFKSGGIDEDESPRYIYQERELVLVTIKVGLILLRIKLGLIFVGV